MHVVNISEIPGRPVGAFGSRSFTVAPLLARAHVVVASVSAGGFIGEHPAVVDQLMVMVSGRAVVSGGNGEPQEVGPGHGVLWTAQERHRTTALTDIVAVIVEGEGLSEVVTGGFGEPDVESAIGPAAGRLLSGWPTGHP